MTPSGLPHPVVVVLALVAAALVAWPARGRPAAARLRALAPVAPEPSPRSAAPGGPRRRGAFAVATAGAVLLLVGGSGLGLVLAAAAGIGVDRLLRRAGQGAPSRDERELEAELPVAADLLAVCLAAGLPVGGAVGAVAAALAPPLGAELAVVAGRYRLGSAPRAAWAEVRPPVAALGRVLVRAGESGSAAAPALHALAADTRAAERGRTEVRVRRAGIWVLAPLGACFLPAFVCLGVAPMVLGLAADVLP